jgi:outer membrane receptor protein involved in Fe transport
VFVIPVNYDKGRVAGVEFEWRQGLDVVADWLGGFTLGFNYTRLESAVEYDDQKIQDLAPFSGNTERPMQAQPNEISNLSLTFDDRQLGISFSVFYSYTGKMLIAGESYSSTGGGETYTPSVFQDPTSGISLSLSKKWQDRLTVTIAARSPLEDKVRQYYEVGDDRWLRSEVPTSADYSLAVGAEF